VKVLITGSTGFLGKWVLKKINEASHSVIVFSGDVRDRKTFPRVSVDAVVHLAAVVDKRFWDSDRLFEVNVIGTQNLLEHYQNSKFIFISSIDVEKSELTKYARTKKDAERLVMANPNNLIIRPPIIFGFGDTHDKLIQRLFNKYLKGQECTIINNEKNEYMHVKMAAQEIVDSLNNQGVKRLRGFKIKNLEIDAMIFAICNGERIPCSTREEQDFFATLGECLPCHQDRK